MYCSHSNRQMFCPSQSPQRAGERSTKINPFSPRTTQNPLYSGTRPDFNIPEKILGNQAKNQPCTPPNKINRNCPSARSATVWHKKLNERSSILQAGGPALPSAPVPLVPLWVTSPVRAQRPRGRCCRRGSPGLVVTSPWRLTAPGNLFRNGHEQHALCGQHPHSSHSVLGTQLGGEGDR